MKKGLLLGVLFGLVLTSCGSQHSMAHEELKKKVDYLYEVTYNDYSWDDVKEWGDNFNPQNNEKAVAGFGCSSIHNGNFYGRSFDFFFTDMCEFVVRTPKTKDRFASIGMSIGNANINEDQLLGRNGKEFKKVDEKLIPFAMVDGINENGVVCNTNVVPACDLIPNYKDGQYHTLGTNKGKEDLFYQFMPRFVLDNAKSAKHAVELLSERNITSLNSKGEVIDYLGIGKAGYELHIMIADATDTYIVELYDNRMNVIHSCANAMTNFYLSASTPSGSGYERFQYLQNNYDKANTFDGMMSIVKWLQFSNAYRPEFERYSDEMAGKKIGDTMVTFWNGYLCGQDPEIYQALVEYCKEKIDIIESDNRTLGTDAPWISTHSCVYSIEERKLTLMTQEQYDRVMEYTL